MPPIENTDALLVVDVQRDFCPGGPMSVYQGDAVVPVLNELIPRFPVVAFSRDWHPEDHVSFVASPDFTDMSWPPHCVRDTPGAAFHPDLIVPPDSIIVSKGTDPGREAYSAFDGTDLAARLGGCARLFVGGLATDYCVKASVLDAIKAGFTVFLITDAVRGVDIPPGSAQQAIDDMKDAGAHLVRSREIA
jgi:nicotinamidase/pyrazinamidase